MTKDIKYDKITKKYHKELMQSLKGLVSINSQFDEKTVSADNPFGEGVSRALDFVARMAKRDGFKVINHANKVVEILYGEEKENITIMAHADVVPEGNGWHYPPFQVTELNGGLLIGRGVSDDKGPFLASYYAVKALRDNDLLPKGVQIRILVGGNEEMGSACMDYYFNKLKSKVPTYGFSPDADFPLIYAEKCINPFDVSKEFKINGLISVKGGVARNAVIDRCYVKFELKSQFIDFIIKNYTKEQAEIHTEDDVTTVTFKGKSAHGSIPSAGVNAGIMALEALAKYSKNKELISFVKTISSLDGSSFNGYYKNPDLADSTSSVGLASWDNKKLKISMDYRHFSTSTQKEIREKIKEAFGDADVKFYEPSPMLYYPINSPLVSALLKAYQDETHDLVTKPHAIGGGTYSKETTNVVAFGMGFPGFDPKMHGADEQILKDDIFKGMRIYARAIIELGKKIKDEN